MRRCQICAASQRMKYLRCAEMEIRTCDVGVASESADGVKGLINLSQRTLVQLNASNLPMVKDSSTERPTISVLQLPSPVGAKYFRPLCLSGGDVHLLSHPL